MQTYNWTIQYYVLGCNLTGLQRDNDMVGAYVRAQRLGLCKLDAAFGIIGNDGVRLCECRSILRQKPEPDHTYGGFAVTRGNQHRCYACRGRFAA